MKKTTVELLKTLKHSVNIEEYFEQQQAEMIEGSLSVFLEQFLEKQGISKSDCIKKSGLDRTYGYQIFAGTKTPTRDKLLAICFALGLSSVDIQALLKSTGYPILYPRIQRDSMILYALEKNLSLVDLNELLFDMDFALVE